jgi:DNA polymerase elongation subunit (family B)
MIDENTLIYDIETETEGRPNPEVDKLKFFGCYSYKTKKMYVVRDKEAIQALIDNHSYLVGYNTKNYDNPILERHKISLKYKYIVDLYDIIDKRATIIKTNDGLLSDLLLQKSLDFVSKLFDLDDGKGKLKINFNIFKKNAWTSEEMQEINNYIQQDINLTKSLYEWMENFFAPFKDFVYEKDVKNKAYLTCAPAALAYKALCKRMVWEEKYNEFTTVDEEDKIKGGYVSYPAGEKFLGNIYCLDFNSMYPHTMMQCNLYGRKQVSSLDNRPVWNGGGSWKLKGQYYADELAPVGRAMQEWFAQRKQYKKEGNKKEYVLKILLNIMYGILDSAPYAQTFDPIAAEDCTGFGRQIIKYARKIFREHGFKVLYTDTDSIYLLDHLDDKQKLLDVKNKIIEYIKTTVPFPQTTFDMGIDAEIKAMFFFKGEGKETEDEDMDEDDFINKPLGLLKKNYLYLTKENKVVVKNLGVKKKSNSRISREIFWHHMIPEIIKTADCKFSKAWIRNKIQELLEKDFSLAGIRFDVGKLEEYTKSPNSIYAQIAKRYNSGIHFLIPNLKNIGVGKDKSYCTYEEYQAQRLRLLDIDLTNVYDELEYFTKPMIIKNIFEF